MLMDLSKGIEAVEAVEAIGLKQLKRGEASDSFAWLRNLDVLDCFYCVKFNVFMFDLRINIESLMLCLKSSTSLEYFQAWME